MRQAWSAKVTVISSSPSLAARCREVLPLSSKSGFCRHWGLLFTIRLTRTRSFRWIARRRRVGTLILCSGQQVRWYRIPKNSARSIHLCANMVIENGRYNIYDYQSLFSGRISIQLDCVFTRSLIFRDLWYVCKLFSGLATKYKPSLNVRRRPKAAPSSQDRRRIV